MTLPVSSELYHFLYHLVVLPEYFTLPDDWSPFKLNRTKLQEVEKEAILRSADEFCAYKIYRNCFWNIKVSVTVRAGKRDFIYFEQLPFISISRTVCVSILLSDFFKSGCSTVQFAEWGNLYHGGITANKMFHFVTMLYSFLRHSASSWLPVYILVDIKLPFL